MTETEKYIAQFPADVRDILNEIRQIIVEEVPEATEKIAYGMPGFYLNKKLWCILQPTKTISDFM